MKKYLTLTFIAAIATLTGCKSTPRQIVQIDRAATLTIPFDNLAHSLPQLDCRQRSAGSRFLLHSDVDLKQPVDVLALADVQLFEQPISTAQTQRFPWWATFAGNEIGIAYTSHSRGAGHIDATNWPEVLQESGVQTGYADPELDPEGYNTVIAWKLAENYYHLPQLAATLTAAIPKRNVRGDSTQLLALLSAGELDYAWEYRSVAEQHHLQFLRLPKEINLGDPALASIYKSACIDLHHGEQMQRQCGRPIVYAVSIAKDAAHPDAASLFVQALYSEAGRSALSAASQQPLNPRIGGDASHTPAWLKALAK